MDIQTATYEQLKSAREEINTRLRELERKTLEDIQAKAHQLGFALVKNGAAPPLKPKAKYRNPDNPDETYSGRGRKPAWLQDKLDAGADVEDFAV